MSIEFFKRRVHVCAVRICELRLAVAFVMHSWHQPKDVKEESLYAEKTDLWKQINDLPPQWMLLPCNGMKQPIDPATGNLMRDWPRQCASAASLKTLNTTFIKAIGVALGPPSGGLLAVDLDNPGYEEQFLVAYEKLLTDLPKTVSWTSGKPGRRQLAYRVPEAYWIRLRGKKVWKNRKQETCLELRWAGHQSIVLGAHPETSGYSWVTGCSPREVRVADAPEWLLAPLMSPKKDYLPLARVEIADDDLQVARNLLRLIRPRDDYDSWLKVGMALHSTDESLLDDFINWSRGAVHFDEQECCDKWSSFKSDGITIATLYYLAKEDGATDADLRLAMGNAKRLEQKGNVKPKYGQLIATMLEAIKADNQDLEMELRARIMCEYRRTDQQVDAALFKLETKNTVGTVRVSAFKGLDLSRIKGADWLIPGFVVQNDLTLVYGSAGSGKTTVALGLADALIKGVGFLDHQIATAPGKVLFIASDSGASPLLAALQDMNLVDQPEYQEHSSKKFFVWASDPDQGMVSWDIGLGNCLKLKAFVVENSIDLVLIDSCKAVFSGAGIDYADNNLVTAVLTFFKQVICPATSVLFINHDGREKGASAGAKAWKEIPSIVHQIKRPDEKNNDGAKSFREWKCVKNRLGSERQFHYVLADGVLAVTHATEVIGDCIDEIVRCLRESPNGELSLRDFGRLLTPAFAMGTIKNTLTNAVNGSAPRLKRVRNKRGFYRLMNKDGVANS